jgi:hypothetical protein
MALMRAAGRATDADADADRPVYTSLFGFARPATRIDPHTHEVRSSVGPDLSKLADLVRRRTVEPEKAAPSRAE